jgi:hypothetical protein
MPYLQGFSKAAREGRLSLATICNPHDHEPYVERLARIEENRRQSWGSWKPRWGGTLARRQLELSRGRSTLRRSILLLTFLVSTAITAPQAQSAVFFLLSPTTAKPGDPVVLRSPGTPEGFRNSSRLKPFQRPLRIYLVRDAIADDVKSPADPRLVFIGNFVGGQNGRGVLRFTVPKLPAGTYTTAWYRSWPCDIVGVCGPKFSTLGPIEGRTDLLPQYAPKLVLHVQGGTSFPWLLVSVLGLGFLGAAVLLRVWLWRRFPRFRDRLAGQHRAASP